MPLSSILAGAFSPVWAVVPSEGVAFAVGSLLRPCEALTARRSSPIRATAEKSAPKASEGMQEKR